MTEKDFKYFVSSTLVNLMEAHKLTNISVTDDNGNKAKIKRDGNDNLISETTIKETM